MPTTPNEKGDVARLLKEVTLLPTASIVDLGSGWGGMARFLAKTYPDHPVIGYEESWFPYLISKWMQWIRPLSNLTFKKENFYRADLSKVGLVYCYLFRAGALRVEKELLPKLPATAQLISLAFAFPNTIPIRQVPTMGLWNGAAYLYNSTRAD